MAHRFDALKIFAVAAETANFRDAAARLGISPQVVTRAVKELEQALGEPLFHRSTRGVQLSTFGEQLAQRARSAVEGVDAIYQDSSRRAAEDHAGVVRLAAPNALGRQFVLEALAPLLRAHPGLVLDLRLSDVRADVVEEQIDVGVRIGPLRDSRFVARAVGSASLMAVASPELLARVGTPASVEDLQAFPRTVLIDRNTGRPWPWSFSEDRQSPVAAPSFVTDDPGSECDAVVAGLGIGQLASHLALPHVRAGRLVAVLEPDQPSPMPVYIYRAQRSPVPVRVRLVYQRLLEALGERTDSF